MSAIGLPLGPVMLDVAGYELTAEDRGRLLHPLTGAVILFARNYASQEQLATLVRAVRALREPPLLIAVDQEGGRVQRLRAGYSPVPAMRALGRLWDVDHEAALAAARAVGTVIAMELVSSGVDFSFTPVLDLDFGVSAAIGDRAFHRDPLAVAELAGAVMAGLRGHGMVAVGKHFPGHGGVAADSHHAVPIDSRPLHALEAADLVPYARLVPLGLPAVMPAHVIYPAVDGSPAGFSATWLREILRGQLGFKGIIFSDDLAMEGAAVAGGVVDRAHAAWAAGCDMVLLCNRPDLADTLLAGVDWRAPADFAGRIAGLHAAVSPAGLAQARRDPVWLAASALLGSLAQRGMV